MSKIGIDDSGSGIHADLAGLLLLGQLQIAGRTLETDCVRGAVNIHVARCSRNAERFRRQVTRLDLGRGGLYDNIVQRKRFRYGYNQILVPCIKLPKACAGSRKLDMKRCPLQPPMDAKFLRHSGFRLLRYQHSVSRMGNHTYVSGKPINFNIFHFFCDLRIAGGILIRICVCDRVKGCAAAQTAQYRKRKHDQHDACESSFHFCFLLQNRLNGKVCPKT